MQVWKKEDNVGFGLESPPPLVMAAGWWGQWVTLVPCLTSVRERNPLATNELLLRERPSHPPPPPAPLCPATPPEGLWGDCGVSVPPATAFLSLPAGEGSTWGESGCPQAYA